MYKNVPEAPVPSTKKQNGDFFYRAKITTTAFLSDVATVFTRRSLRTNDERCGKGECKNDGLMKA